MFELCIIFLIGLALGVIIGMEILILLFLKRIDRR